jgi:hypothetical protein
MKHGIQCIFGIKKYSFLIQEIGVGCLADRLSHGPVKQKVVKKRDEYLQIGCSSSKKCKPST